MQLTLGERAGFVEHDHADSARSLKDLRAADEDAQLSPATNSCQHRCRCGQSQCAWAGNNKHRQGSCHRSAPVASQCPHTSRNHSNSQHNRDKDARDTVGESLRL